MSGHSHAKTVKRTKDANDAKRGKIFSKLSRLISIAAKNGSDPESNAKLKQAVDEARKANMPKENVAKAIQRGSGETKDGEQLEEVLYEALGPGGANIIIEGITDNKNRTLLEVRQILQKNNGKLASEGSMKWAFEQKGIIVVEVKQQDKDELELKAIEAGAEDTKWFQQDKEKFLEIITAVDNLEQAKQNLENQNIVISSSALGWLAKEETSLPEKETTACEKLFDALDDNDDIQQIYSNLKS